MTPATDTTTSATWSMRVSPPPGGTDGQADHRQGRARRHTGVPYGRLDQPNRTPDWLESGDGSPKRGLLPCGGFKSLEHTNPHQHQFRLVDTAVRRNGTGTESGDRQAGDSAARRLSVPTSPLRSTRRSFLVGPNSAARRPPLTLQGQRPHEASRPLAGHRAPCPGPKGRRTGFAPPWSWDGSSAASVGSCLKSWRSQPVSGPERSRHHGSRPRPDGGFGYAGHAVLLNARLLN
jgi:hypothetical protein